MPWRETLPQLVTTAVTVLASPLLTVLQVFVTRRHGFSVTLQTALADAWTGVPQTLRAVAVTRHYRQQTTTQKSK